MTSKNNRALLLYYFVHHFKSIGEFKLELQSGNTRFGSKSAISCPVWPWNLMDDNRAHLLYYIKLCASFEIHRRSQTWITVRKRLIRVKIGNFLSRVTLIFDGWHWKNRAPLLSCLKLCESFYSHWWIQTGVTIRKRPIWVIIDDFVSRVTLNLTDDLEKQ